jgi:hypothetical protein
VGALTERYADKIREVLSCFNRVMITATPPDICYADVMREHLRSTAFAFSITPSFPSPYGTSPREKDLPQENGLEIEFIQKKDLCIKLFFYKTHLFYIFTIGFTAPLKIFINFCAVPDDNLIIFPFCIPLKFVTFRSLS